MIEFSETIDGLEITVRPRALDYLWVLVLWSLLLGWAVLGWFDQEWIMRLFVSIIAGAGCYAIHRYGLQRRTIQANYKSRLVRVEIRHRNRVESHDYTLGPNCRFILSGGEGNSLSMESPSFGYVNLFVGGSNATVTKIGRSLEAGFGNHADSGNIAQPRGPADGHTPAAADR